MATGKTDQAPWVCPSCGRQFARARQSHSCKATTVDSHFADKDPKLRQMFDAIATRLSKKGSFRAEAVRTAIHLTSRHHFAGINVRRDSLRIGFLAPEPIQSARIVHRLVLGPARVEHVVVLKDIKDVDDQLLGWLSDAQQLQS